jgi:phosphoglycerol transferase MdoB-like AlkP superfamily enzyme
MAPIRGYTGKLPVTNSGFVFNNFYNPLFPVSTSDGEYITDTSLIPKEGVWSAYRSKNNYLPFVLGNAFNKMNYKTTAYHDHTSTYYYRNYYVPNFGYVYYACGRGLNINCKQWPESDLDMINATYNQYMDNSPFLTYYVTVSGHLRYNTYNSMAVKNWSAVKNLSYSTAIKAYMACNIELDKALAQLIQYLSDKGILDNTVIEISGDHYPYGLTLDEMNEKSDFVRDDNFDKHKSSLVIWSSSMKEPINVDKLSSSIDILPTLLNLFDQLSGTSRIKGL